VGIGVASVEAFGVGGASLPRASLESEYPPRGWLYIASKPVEEKVATEGIHLLHAQFQFDLGAMRKIDKGILFLQVEQNNIIVGGVMSMVGRVRSLCLT